MIFKVSPRTCDAVVLGGGPAGIAAATALHREGLSVVLIEKRPRGSPRVGETLGAEVGPLLERAGLWSIAAPVLGKARPFTLVRSAWGGAELDERPSILHPLGAGWHLDRSILDEALLDALEVRGVEVHRGISPRVERDESGAFRVCWAGGELMASRLVDASGRGQGAAVMLGEARWVALDRQVALVATYEPDDDPSLTLEALPEGFFYSAPVDGGLVVAWVTDADLLTRHGRGRAARFERALMSSLVTRERIGRRALRVGPFAHRSESGYLLPDRGERWCAVGDAAHATDPLGGQGVARGLTSGLEAVAKLSGERTRPGDLGRYLDTRGRYYALEGRFADEPFWRRRRPTGPTGEHLDWREVELTVSPETVLVFDGLEGTARDAAEAWLPADAITWLGTRGPAPAHLLLGGLRELTGLEPRRLLVAIEWLISVGGLRTGTPTPE